jgi:conjugal transfer mating pair stabilization protein TraG
MTQDQIAEFKQFGDRVSRDSSFMNVIATDAREAKDISSRLATTTSRAERAEATFSERAAFAERLASARERGETISIDIAQDPHNVEMFMRYAEQYGGNSAAAFAMLDAELARRALRPNRVFTDGSALPGSFGDIRGRHNEVAGHPDFNADIGAINRRDEAQVARFNPPVPDAAKPVPSNTRGDIHARGKELREQARSAGTEFDAKAEVINTPDGTLASKKSLLKQTGRQVVEDASTSLRDAKDAVKDLLKRN